MDSDMNEMMDQETIDNMNEMSYHNRILKLRAALKISASCATSAIMGKPDNVSETVWMAAKLGEIHRFCQDALNKDTPVLDISEVTNPTEENNG